MGDLPWHKGGYGLGRGPVDAGPGVPHPGLQAGAGPVDHVIGGGLAGQAKGTPYLYFPGKEALFIALYEEWDCGLATRVDAAVGGLAEPARHSPRRVLATVASAIAAHVTGNPQTCRVLMEATTLAAYEPAIAAKVQTAKAAARDQLAGLFQAGVATGEWPPGSDPALRARLFSAGLYGLMAQWHLAPGSFCLETAMGALAGTVGAGPGGDRGDADVKGADP